MSQLTQRQGEMLKKLMDGGQLTELENIELEATSNPFLKQKAEDAVNHIIYCWSCRRALQKPQMFRNIKLKGKGSNTFRMKCMCGESTEVKF